MRRELKLVLPMMLLVLALGTAFAAQQTHEILVTIPEIAELEISEDTVDLGSFLVDNLLQDRIESTSPLKVTYRCNHLNGWALKVSADDFVNNDNSDITIPVDYLYFGTEPGMANQKMAKDEVEVVRGTEPVNTTTDIYYAMERPENAYAGEYSSTVTYTLVTL